jgi:hypothetical protein
MQLPLYVLKAGDAKFWGNLLFVDMGTRRVFYGEYIIFVIIYPHVLGSA